MTELHEWLMRVFGIDKNTSATILITLFVFISGGLINQFYQSLRSDSVRRMRRRIVFLNLLDLSKAVKTQADSYLKFVEQLQMKGNKQLTFHTSHMSQILNLRQVGYEQMFNAFFPSSPFRLAFNRKSKLKAFHKLWHILEVVNYWQQHANDDYVQFLSVYNQFNNQRNEAVEGYRRFIDPLLLRFHGQEIEPGVAEYLKKIDAIHVTWQKEEHNRWPSVLHKELILPLRAVNKHYKNSIVVDMNRHLLSASIHYENMRNLQAVKEKQFFFYYVLFKAKRKQLDIVQVRLQRWF